MRILPLSVLLGLAALANVSAAQSASRIVVLAQPGFPTVASEPVSQDTLHRALGTPVFATVEQLHAGSVLAGASLLVLPYGSAFPAAAAPSIERYLKAGGNLLLLGGEPLRVPVEGDREGTFTQLAPQDSYSRLLDFRHSYPAPLGDRPTRFTWREGYGFLPAVSIKAKQVFVEEGRLQGLGYLDGTQDGATGEDAGMHLAAPVIVADRNGSRVVALPFTPERGYWESADGVRLIGAMARYAAAGATSFSIETQYAALRPGELPELTLHLRRGQAKPATGATSPIGPPAGGTAKVELLAGDKVLESTTVALGGDQADAPVVFAKPLAAGLYTVHATWFPSGSLSGSGAGSGAPAADAAGQPQEYAENGFVVENLSALESGDALGTHGDFLSLGGKPFLPVGTNYFTTEENGWDFSGPRNDAVWERDFADMERHGVNFVRTGVWMSNAKFVEPATGGVNERFLRNLEAYLAAAHRHHIAINFTCFAFSPRVGEPRRMQGDNTNTADPVQPNPYLDAGAVHAEQAYVASIVAHFRKVPWLSYDLINEPSFSNPHVIFHGNAPNNDPAEVSAWHAWLPQHYSTLAALADAWRTTPGELGEWGSIPLPKQADLGGGRYGNAMQVRALDYNLFAQDMFAGWVRGMVATIRAAGSNQLVNVGQDEGGVTDRVLNQFYATAGVAFTTNHTYWQDEGLLWDSVAAKRPGLPNITGETGYQPAWNPDGTWRYDELTGTAIEERKWVLGFAAGSSGALQWDWAREVDFGMQRSDGSAKVWENMMRSLGQFAKEAAPYATGLSLPEVAIVLPQSLQLSTRNAWALEAQQTAVRVLYQYDRSEAYAVGEYQINTLGTPKLIVLPSAYGLTEAAWAGIEARVKAGATLLISGPFMGDAHMHATDRAQAMGLPAELAPLQQREQQLDSPAGSRRLRYGGMKTTTLDRATLPGGKSWSEMPLGQGKVLFATLPLELNDNLEAVAAVYAYALKTAGVGTTYTTEVKDPGILICPTKLPHATLYVLSSETATMPVSFTDGRSGKTFRGTLDAGRAALLLVDEQGKLVTSYGWHTSM